MLTVKPAGSGTAANVVPESLPMFARVMMNLKGRPFVPRAFVLLVNIALAPETASIVPAAIAPPAAQRKMMAKAD